MKLRAILFMIGASCVCAVSNGSSLSHSTDADPLLYGQAIVGLGTPYGLTGAGLAFNPMPWVGIEAGAGIGASTGSVQFALVPYLRIPINSVFAAGLGAGLSEGAYKDNQPLVVEGKYPAANWDHALWFDTEVFSEVRLKKFRLKGSLGIAKILNGSDGKCTVYGWNNEKTVTPCDSYSANSTHNDALKWHPYVGFTAGYQIF